MSLYQLLSDNTESEHKALLQHELVSGLMCPSLDAPKYHSILLAHYYWFLNMELKLTKYLSVRTLNMFGYKFKTPAIKKTLRILIIHKSRYTAPNIKNTSLQASTFHGRKLIGMVWYLRQKHY